jgi:hypothetical protein
MDLDRDVRMGCFWRGDIEQILRGVTAAYLASAHPREALIVARYAQALALAFDVHLELPWQISRGVTIEWQRLKGECSDGVGKGGAGAEE